MPHLCVPVLHLKTLAQVEYFCVCVCVFKICVHLKNCANEGHVEQNTASCIVWKTSIKRLFSIQKHSLSVSPLLFLLVNCVRLVLGMLIMTGKVKLISAPFELAIESSWCLHEDLTEFKLIKSCPICGKKISAFFFSEEAFICSGFGNKMFTCANRPLYQVGREHFARH